VDDTDEQLVRSYRDGSDAAFTELVERHGARVYNLCLRILGDPDDAADASQDTFVAAIRKLNTFRGEAAFTTWLHRVAVNACYDALRRKRRQPMLHVVREQDGDPSDAGPPVADHAGRVELSVDVERALREVPEDFRVALVLADVEDLPYERIAELLGVAVGTVKSRVFRGRAALGRALGLREPGGRSPASEGGA
jgi:RNA polymerase sigma-70 factor (ECF subfamily)